MGKPQRSIRLSGKASRILGREIVRLTIHPILLALSGDFVNWGGPTAADGKIHPQELVLKAARRFPGLSLTGAVEGYIILLAGLSAAGTEPYTVEPYDTLPEQVRRFQRLSPSGKIRIGERWKRELEVIRRAG